MYVQSLLLLRMIVTDILGIGCSVQVIVNGDRVPRAKRKIQWVAQHREIHKNGVGQIVLQTEEPTRICYLREGIVLDVAAIGPYAQNVLLSLWQTMNTSAHHSRSIATGPIGQRSSRAKRRRRR